VGIVMGSDSDYEVMKGAAQALDELGIGNEMTVLSAHRTPHQAAEYFAGAAPRGLKVIIAGAGMAAHLAGAAAAHTHLPIIGVPILGKAFNGMDSLLSTVMMPPGLPVATVAVNGSRNAGILAAQIIATGDTDVAQRVVALRKKGEEKVLATAAEWKKSGPKAPPAA
jgi:phosphoribosylaminoimidazole carboxylase PurE protein